MPDVKISDLPAAADCAEGDLVPVVQGGVTKKATRSQVRGYASKVTITATEDIPAFAPVLSIGRVANSANPSQGFGKVIGIAPAAIANGNAGDVVQSGEMTNPLWNWTAGDVIFINGTSLAATPPATGFSQSIGTAKNATTIFVELGQPILF